MGRGRLVLRVLFPLVASLLGLVTLRLLGPDVASQERLSAWLEPLGRWAPLAFVAFLVVRPVTLLPGQLFAAVGGMLFGTLAGTAYALAGSLLSGVLVFLLTRRHGSRWMKRWTGERYAALSASARRHDFLFGFISCINPLVPTDVMLALAASTGARLWPTVLGVVAGSVPGTLLTVQFGSALGQGQTVLTVLSAVGLLASLGLGIWLARRIHRELQEASGADQGPGTSGSPDPSSRSRTASSRVTRTSTSAATSLAPPRVT